MRRRLILLIGLSLAALATGAQAQSTLAARLDKAIKAAGVAISGVEIGDSANKATWRVKPLNLQGAAQPTIDAFNHADPALTLADEDAAAAIAYKRMDRLATMATMAEAYNPNWAAMTNAQKRAEVVRLAKRWEQHRNWVTRNYEFMNF